MNPRNYGLVFRHQGKFWLARYVTEAGEVEDPFTIDDRKGIYKELTLWEMSVVQITEPQQDVFELRDLKVITVENAADPTRNVEDLVRGGCFHEMAKMLYESILDS